MTFDNEYEKSIWVSVVQTRIQQGVDAIQAVDAADHVVEAMQKRSYTRVGTPDDHIELPLEEFAALSSALAAVPGHAGHEFTPDEVRRGLCSCPACSYERAAESAPPPTPDSTH